MSPQDRGQKLVDIYGKAVTEMAQQLRKEQADVWSKLNDTWKAETRKEFGNHVETDLKMAKAVIEEYGGTPEQVRDLMAHMNNNGMGNYAGLLRLLRNIGKQVNIFEDGIVAGNQHAPKMPKTAGNRGWYDKSLNSNGASAS